MSIFNKKNTWIRIDATLTIVIFLFGMIYEMFSHGVFSPYMVFAFVFPLCVLMLGIICQRKQIHLLSSTLLFMHMGVYTWMIGSIVMGIVEIYGTTNSLISIYGMIGFSLLVIAIIVQVISTFQTDKHSS